MGIGDWIMAAGEARALHAKTGQPVVIVDARGRPQWHEVFAGVPYIARRGGHMALPVHSASGQRPYILAKTPTRWRWQPYRPKPAELVLTAEERAFAEPYRGAIMVEPHVKVQQHANKAWPFKRWQDVVWAMRLPARGALRFVQCGPAGTTWLRDVERCETETFRKACAVLSVARAFVGTEGGLMHAAAALGTPAVVLWSEFIAPEVTGYPSMRNLRHAGEACGSRLPCRGCAESMQRITVDEVVRNLEEIL